MFLRQCRNSTRLTSATQTTIAHFFHRIGEAYNNATNSDQNLVAANANHIQDAAEVCSRYYSTAINLLYLSQAAKTM